MNKATSDAPEPKPVPGQRGGEDRSARSIRFSDSEWKAVERAAKERDMNAAEFARHAALGVADGRYRTDRAPCRPNMLI